MPSDQLTAPVHGMPGAGVISRWKPKENRPRHQTARPKPRSNGGVGKHRLVMITEEIVTPIFVTRACPRNVKEVCW
eukprot:9478814-Pyramimonas_sp.AAC.1